MINWIKKRLYASKDKQIEQLTKEVGELKAKLVKSQLTINETNRFYKQKIWNIQNRVK